MVNDYYPKKFLIKYHQFEKPKEFDLWDSIDAKAIELGGRKIVFGSKALEKDLVQYDFLFCLDGPAFVAHKRVLEIFNKLCPEDIQALPVIIKNLDPKDIKFENKDFVLINVLNRIEIYDKSFIRFTENGVPKIDKKVLIDKNIGNHLICMDVHSTAQIFYPLLAKHFIKSRGVQFLIDEEAPI